MEPPRKRQRLSANESPAPTEDFDLQTARAQNDQKLKSIFEGIFEKYGRDFSDIGDEIDLRTGEIVVNKGHVLRMEHEDDTGESLQSRKVMSQFISNTPPRPKTSDGPSISEEGQDDEYLNTGVNYKDVADENNPPLPPLNSSPIISRANDPLWQAPEIDAKFWTPPKKATPKKATVTPHIERATSPSTAPSIWAIRTPRRPRGSLSKTQTASSNKKSSTTGRKKRKRKVRAVLDWSFAQRKNDDDSDSDDPLQEDAPSSSVLLSSNHSIKIRGRTSSVPQSPKVINLMPSNETIDIITISDDDETHEDGGAKMTTQIPDTPQVRSSSPAMIGDDTPTQKSYAINLESPTFIQPNEEIILTPDEVKLIVKLRSEYMDMEWEEFVDHLPGRTLDDLVNWADRHPHLLDGMVTTSGWSRADLEKLHKLADKPGIWWRDFQTTFPHRSRAEIENQVIRFWSENRSELQGQDQEEKEGEEENEELLPNRRRYSDDEDPALRTGDVMANEELEDFLEEESDHLEEEPDHLEEEPDHLEEESDHLEEESENDWSEISAIDLKARTTEAFNGTPRGSPRKGSASPRKYY